MKSTIIIILIILCAILFVRSCKKEIEANEVISKEKDVAKAIQTEATILARQTDKKGNKRISILTNENLISAKEAMLPGILDTTAIALNIQKNQIEILMVINSSLKAENLKAKQRIDSLGRTLYYYHDKYLQLSYRPSDKADSTDKGEFDYKYNADLNIVQYNKRKWFLAAKKSYTDIYSSDPRFTINGVKRLTVIQKEPAFGFRLQASSSFNFGTGKLSPGITGRFDINRFSVSGSYYYNINDQNWFPTIGANYDLIRF